MSWKVTAVFVSVCAFVLCASCASGPVLTNGRVCLPIKVISGKVRVEATGFLETDRRNGDLSRWVNDHDTARRMDDYDKLVPAAGMTQTICESSEKTAGDSISYALRVHESVTVTVTALNGDAIVECSGVQYDLSGWHSSVRFSFVH